MNVGLVLMNLGLHQRLVSSPQMLVNLVQVPVSSLHLRVVSRPKRRTLLESRLDVAQARVVRLHVRLHRFGKE